MITYALALLPNRIALIGRAQDGDTFRRSSEFETLDRILYLNVNVMIFSLMDSLYHYFSYGFYCFFFFVLLTNEARWVFSLTLFAKSRSDI